MSDGIYWINGPWQGQLAIVARPRGGDWLVDDVKQWKRAKIDVVISLLEANEATELGLQAEGQTVRVAGLHFLSLSIGDRQTPSSRQAVVELLNEVIPLLVEGKNIAVHCRQGIGRSSLIAACLLVQSGANVKDAFAQIEDARGRSVPDTPEQMEWVERFARWRNT